jgi:hypothetical protein
MSAVERAARRARWKQAVERARGWTAGVARADL